MKRPRRKRGGRAGFQQKRLSKEENLPVTAQRGKKRAKRLQSESEKIRSAPGRKGT